MKKVYVLAVSLALTLVMGARAQLVPTGPDDTDTMAKMSIVELQGYFGGLEQNDFNLAMQNILATNNARFIRVAIAAAQKAINAKPKEDRVDALNSLLTANKGQLIGTIGANGNALLGKATDTPRKTKIGVDVPITSKLAATAAE